MERIRQRRRSSTGEDQAPALEHLKFNNAYPAGSDESSIDTSSIDSAPTSPSAYAVDHHALRPHPCEMKGNKDKEALRELRERKSLAKVRVKEETYLFEGGRKEGKHHKTPSIGVLAKWEGISVESARKFRFRNLSAKPEPSILDQKSSRDSTFFGFFILFWVTVGVIVLRMFVYNYCQKSIIIDNNLVMILKKDLWKVALTDFALYCSTYFAYVWQLGIKKGYLNWESSGYIVQHLWQALTIFWLLWFEQYMDFPWIGCVYLLLHCLVLLMKEHSYAFYNGYLWQVYNDLKDAKEALSNNEFNPNDIEQTQEEELLKKIAEFSNDELKMQSNVTRFPDNITFRNYFAYSMFPTLIYQIEYPRTERIRKNYVIKKLAATFGVFFILIVVSENYLYPIAIRAMELRNEPLSLKVREYIFILLDLVPPFILIYLLTFYIIWDAILNAIAELTCFGDREFYGEWWNCVAWDQFAKDWNVPVHRFLLRHVYHSSISAFHLSKYLATICTFLLSSLVHELVMFVIFRKLRGYLFCLQMCQLPLVALSRTKYMRGRHILGNTMFWFGIVTGPSIMCSLYLTF